MEHPWLLIENFNQFRFAIEKYSAKSKMEKMEQFQTSAGLVEMQSTSVWFTWSNNRDGHDLVMERLDKAFGNKKQILKYSHSHLYCIPISILDYSLIQLDANRHHKYKRHLFHFQNMWLMNESCIKIVTNAWNKIQSSFIVYQLIKRLNKTKKALVQKIKQNKTKLREVAT